MASRKDKDTPVSMADKKKGKISLKFSIPLSNNDNDVDNKPAAEWMSGKWVSCTILIYVTTYSILVI